MSRFEFAGDSAALELPRLEEEARLRRDGFRNRIRAIDDRTASWTARLTQEALDRDSANAALVDRAVHTPLEKCAAAAFALLNVHDDDGPTARRALASAPVRAVTTALAASESELLTFKHRTVFHARNLRLLSLQRDLTERVSPQLQMECTKADKREGTLVRRFEALAAGTTRGMLEQRSLNAAEFETLGATFDHGDRDGAEFYRRREEEFLERVRAFRQLLRMEQAERRKQDEAIVEQILDTQEKLQRSVLESLTGGHTVPPSPSTTPTK